MNPRIPRLVNIVLLALLFLVSAMVWDKLPAVIPTHFDSVGHADKMVEKSLLSWFGLPLIALFISVLFAFISVLITRKPNLINIPNKKAFLELPPERQAPVVFAMQYFLAWIGVFLTLMMSAIQYGTYRSAMGSNGQPIIIAAVIVELVVMPILSLTLLVRVQRMIKWTEAA